MKKQIWKGLLVISFVIISGSSYSCGLKKDTEMISLVPETDVSLPDRAEDPPAGTESPAAEISPAVCYVYVCGAVQHAGVYEVAEGERIFRVLELAGGYTGEAAEEYLNLASPVTDGMRLFVPTKAEMETLDQTGFLSQMLAETSREPSGGSAGVNLNKASKEELMTLTGIGEAKADAIIRYRQESGGFNRIEDIMNISGIKQSAFDKIKDNITVTD